MGAGASATQIDTLIAAQKEIINATWNLERRSGAGRSAEDLKAVAEAQAELKGRAEQIAGRGPRGGRGLFPQQLLPPRGSGRSEGRDPVAAAIGAMTQAVEHLQGARTANAIEHEMAALRGLLQAQAEVRRRQVMQQSASAAGQGGSNRSDRDLSALFDRELQRQQRTNYETPPQSAETPPQNESELLDRIRELARRQAELAARQRELAGASLPAEELKRQLEQLSREQEELRQQAEALQNDVKRATPANAGRGRGGAPSGSSGEMQRAAEQMRNAASEMQRQNAGGAAASGERAAEALRQIDRQMRGSSADARQRTAGELRLEAQQIADAQRRGAAEAARLEKERTGSATDRATADALKRLAAEKDKLAERIDRLQQGARDAERDAPGADGAPLREAARQLQGQQAGARMRESAQQLRDRAAGTGASPAGTDRQSASAAPSAAQREQQLTRTLESVADALNGGGPEDGRKLAEQLDRTREMRDRLNGLEQQLRSAEAQAAAGRSSEGRSGAPSPGGGRGSEQGGRQAGQGSGSGNGSGAVQRAREEYARELQRSRESLGRMRAEQRGGLGGSTPEQHEFSRSAPGNEAFKQDFGSWESLRKDIDLALEQFEAAASSRLAPKAADRLSGGGNERIPDAYRPVVSRYFEAIAKPAVRRPPEKK
jgi:cell division protein FtsB